MKNVLITGGAGNVGEFVARELEGRYEVTLFDRVPPSRGPNPFETKHRVVLGDLTNPYDCMRAINAAGAELIVHLGGIRGKTERGPAENGEPWMPVPEDETFRSNALGTWYLMDAARRLGVKRVAFASTFWVLGIYRPFGSNPWIPRYLPIDEDHPLEPDNSYGLSKLCGEEILKSFYEGWGIESVALRLNGVFDRAARGGEPMQPKRPEGDPNNRGGPPGGTSYQYVDVRDAATAFRLALEADGLGGFEAFYIQTDTVLEEPTAEVVSRTCPDYAGMAKKIKGHDGMISGARARERLGFVPAHSWRKGA